MNGYPNSVSNNMVNTEYENPYKINITTLPQPRVVYDYRKDMSKKIKTALVAAAVAAAAFGAVAYQGQVQVQSMIEGSQVVYSEDVVQYPGFKFEITKSGEAYYMDEQGNHYASLGDDMVAQQRANQYIESGFINLPSRTK